MHWRYKWPGYQQSQWWPLGFFRPCTIWAKTGSIKCYTLLPIEWTQIIWYCLLLVIFIHLYQLGESYTYLSQNVLHIDMDLIISAMFIIWNIIPQNHPVFCRNKFNKWAARWVASWRPWSPNPPLHRPARPTGPTGWWHELTHKLLKSFYWWSHVWRNGAWNEQVCQSVPPR